MKWVPVDAVATRLPDWLERPASLRGHWLALLVLAASYELGGAIPGGAIWSGRRWRLACGFGLRTLKRLESDGLATRSGDDIRPLLYDTMAENRAKQSRENARNSSLVRWARHAARMNQLATAAIDPASPVQAGPAHPMHASKQRDPPPPPPLNGGEAPAAPPASPATEPDLKANAAAIATAWPWGDAHAEPVRRALWRLGKRGVAVDVAAVLEAFQYGVKTGWRRRAFNRKATAASFVRDEVHVELLAAKAAAASRSGSNPALVAPAPAPLSPDQFEELRRLRRAVAK